jgi:YVTN family beta-propeller protein
MTHMRLTSKLSLLAATVGCLFDFGPRPSLAQSPQPGAEAAKVALRRPAALALADHGRWLLVANQRTGSITLIDTVSLEPVSETQVGEALSDLTLLPDGAHVLALDAKNDELVILRRAGTTLTSRGRLKIPTAPVCVRCSSDGTRAIVGSSWSRVLSVVDTSKLTEPDGKVQIVRTIDLPFAPRGLMGLPDSSSVIVTDAFGGSLAVVDTARGTVSSSRSLPAHNIRGLVLAPNGLYLTHQTLNPRSTTSTEDIHWGNLLTNNVRLLNIAAVVNPHTDLLQGSTLYQLGEVGHGAADPSGIVMTSAGDVVVALSGVGEVALGQIPLKRWAYLPVGRGPTGVAADSQSRRAYVSNAFDDSVSVIDLREGKVLSTISLGPNPEMTASDRGEALFHDARLSLEGWLSCQSCHTDGHTNGLLNDNLSDGTFDTPKRVLSLRGVGDTGPWAWNGAVPDLATQIRNSVGQTMRGPAPTAQQVDDMVSFLRTLTPAPPREPVPDITSDESFKRGRDLFAEQSCGRCHVAPTFTSPKSYQVGITDEAGQNAFNPPSLRGVSQGAPYFHDGRAATLEDVFVRFKHQLTRDFSRQEVNDLMRYLRSV